MNDLLIGRNRAGQSAAPACGHAAGLLVFEGPAASLFEPELAPPRPANTQDGEGAEIHGEICFQPLLSLMAGKLDVFSTIAASVFDYYFTARRSVAVLDAWLATGGPSVSVSRGPCV